MSQLRWAGITPLKIIKYCIQMHVPMGTILINTSHHGLYAHLQFKYSIDQMDSRAISSERQACRTWNVKYCCHFSPCPIVITEKKPLFRRWLIRPLWLCCMDGHMLASFMFKNDKPYVDGRVQWHLGLILKPLNFLIYMLPKLTVMVTRVMGWIWEWFMTAGYVKVPIALKLSRKRNPSKLFQMKTHFNL